MKTFLKTLLALTLITAFLLAGCKKLDWQTISCEVPLLSAVFIHEDGYTRLETSDTSEYQAISFKLPKEYYFTENRGEYNNENQKTWTDGESYFVIYGITLVNSDDFFMHKTELGLDKMMLKRTVLDNGIIDSLTYPRMHYENDERKNFTDDEPTSHGHFVDVAFGDYVISFTVYEYCPLGSPVISDETIEFIQTIANSFECTAEMVMNESEISPEDLALAEKAAVDFGKLHNVEEWDNAEEDIPVHMFVYWYLNYINSVTTYEERVERYTPTFWKYGWAYPEEEFEAYIQKYFDVSTEYLRSGDCYYANEGVYLLDQIGGANLGYKVRLSETKPTVDGDIMYIPMELSFNGDFRDTAYRTLVIQKTEDGYKYLECFEYEKKVEFPKFSLYLTSGYGVEGDTIFYNSLTSIKFIETYPATERDEVFANAEKEYKESEFFARESEYSDGRLSWKEYTVQIPLPEESGLDLVDNFSYYFVSYKDMIIKFETRPVIYGMGGSQRDKIEDILKTIEYID